MAKKYASLSTLQAFLDNLKNLFATKTEMNKKADVQIITQDKTETTIEDITSLKIHKLSQEQYNDLVANDSIDETALYLTPADNYTQTEVDEMMSTHTHSYDDLRNKPFYEGTDYSSIFVNGAFTSNFYEWGSGIYGAAITDAPKVFTQDISYKVIWDGVEYTMTCTYGGDNESGNPITSIGASYGDYTNYPFGIDSYQTTSSTYEYSIHTKSIDTTHTIDILELGSKFVTLDEKFIPDTIARTVDTDIALSGKSNVGHTHNDIYYTKTEIDNIELITVEDIDNICGSTV